MGYFIRLFRIVPDEPPPHRAHLRNILRGLYKAVLRFGMLIVALPIICYDAPTAEILRAEFSNREVDVVIFESNWLHQTLERALNLVVDFSDYDAEAW
ncbi:uncharacterized protein Triagg1_2330 [Trichoderma aggressivum f. europaeum]|uniref:Uncharacterized protein n=1 Tax=Trichoderma aggressivum f. europaeum TaxID=173218 RepID=A0AAE1IGU7_9HYPO|nr:hypothetical protein Triagg1_2330 [Trichoderma aggressivum f. europaeum]